MGSGARARKLKQWGHQHPDSVQSSANRHRHPSYQICPQKQAGVWTLPDVAGNPIAYKSWRRDYIIYIYVAWIFVIPPAAHFASVHFLHTVRCCSDRVSKGMVFSLKCVWFLIMFAFCRVVGHRRHPSSRVFSCTGFCETFSVAFFRQSFYGCRNFGDLPFRLRRDRFFRKLEAALFLSLDVLFFTFPLPRPVCGIGSQRHTASAMFAQCFVWISFFAVFAINWSQLARGPIAFWPSIFFFFRTRVFSLILCGVFVFFFLSLAR